MLWSKVHPQVAIGMGSDTCKQWETMAELSWHWWSLVGRKVTVRQSRSCVCCWETAGLFMEFKDWPGFILMPCLDDWCCYSCFRVMYVLACLVIATVTPQPCIFVAILQVSTMIFSVLLIISDFLSWIMCSECRADVADIYMLMLLCNKDRDNFFLGAKFYKQICFQFGLDLWEALN